MQQSDEVIWQIINHQFCSYKTKIARERTFCQNPYNVTGLCIRSACPLANSRYATIREEDGECYLYLKTIERAHTPKNLWEKIKLPSNYMKALELVSTHLEHFPKYLVHRNKQRLTKIHQMLIRMRKLKLKAKPKIVTINTKVEKREKGKERKALKAAQLERAIEKELLERLKQATEGEIFNYPEQEYSKALSRAAASFEEEEGEQESEGEQELEFEEELEEDEEDEEGYNVEYVEDLEESDDEEADIEHSDEALAALYASIEASKKKRKSGGEKDESATDSSKRTKSSGVSTKRGGKGPRVEVEYEEETEDEDLRQRRQRVQESVNNMDFNF